MTPTLTWGQRVALALVAAYRVTLKPLLPAACRFQPSCSVYAAEAIRVHGAGRGLVLAAKRLLACRPGGGGGLDPVPPRRTAELPPGRP